MLINSLCKLCIGLEFTGVFLNFGTGHTGYFSSIMKQLFHSQILLRLCFCGVITIVGLILWPVVLSNRQFRNAETFK